jgi:AcrR family transcriptional regulator
MTAKRSKPLTRAEIFTAALTIIDAEGTDALSMRRLARELGVEAMSLYHHVANKEAVLDGVVALALTTQAPTAAPPAGSPWQEVVLGAILGFRRALVAHPNVLPHVVEHPPSSPEASAMYIHGPLQFLVANGVPQEDAAEMFAATFALSFGHALLTTNYPTIPAAEGTPAVAFTEESFARAVRVMIDAYSGEGALRL